MAIPIAIKVPLTELSVPLTDPFRSRSRFLLWAVPLGASKKIGLTRPK